MEHTGKQEAQRTSQHMEGWDWEQRTKKKPQVEECFDRELWRVEYVFGLKKTIYSQKYSFSNK
jgi:hypothetical protein